MARILSVENFRELIRSYLLGDCRNASVVIGIMVRYFDVICDYFCCWGIVVAICKGVLLILNITSAWARDA